MRLDTTDAPAKHAAKTLVIATAIALYAIAFATFTNLAVAADDTVAANSTKAAVPGTTTAARRPNIVFIFSDDHAWQAVSAYGESRRLLDTPNIDRIAKQGVRFDRCLVPNSICGPSRATVLTGKYSHANGFYNNTNSRFDGTQTTFPKLLRGAGYQTAVIGKWHLVSEPTGFDHWHILPGQGVYYNPPMIRDGQNVKHQGYVTDIITDLSVEWLKGRDKTKPFMLMCQHKAPHREWAPALRHLGHNGDRVYPEPDTLFDDYAGRGKAEREQDMTLAQTFTPLDAKLATPAQLNAEQRAQWDAYYGPRNEAFRKQNPQGRDLVKWRYQRYLHDYLGCIKAVDESVGRLLQFLDDEGLADNTIVMYSSDQGFFLGEHGWFDKRWIFEESLRTPLVVRWPGVAKPGSVNNDLVSNVDFAATFLEAAGVAAPADLQGPSLAPLLRGQTPQDWRQSFYYHYYEFPGPHSVRRHYGVVDRRYKLVRFYEPQVDAWELFDLEKDPREMRSVYGDPAYAETAKRLHAELDRLRRELKVPDPDPAETEIRLGPPTKNNPAKNNPAKKNPAKNNPGINNPGKNNPGKNNPEKNNPEKNNPGKDNPGKDNPGKKDSGTNHAGKDEPANTNPAQNAGTAKQASGAHTVLSNVVLSAAR